MRESMRRGWIAGAVLVAASVAGCTDDGGGARCVPGMSITCACSGSATGSQTCQPDGTYGACVCDGVDAGVDAPTITDSVADVGAPDTGAPDTGAPDTGPGDVPVDVMDDATTDAGPADVGVDGGPMDTGPMDTGSTDVGPMDSGPTDTGVVDGGPMDTGPVDTGPRDTGPVDVPVDRPDAGSPDAGSSLEFPGALLTQCTYPWRSAGCTLWTQSPPGVIYAAAFDTPEGLWALSYYVAVLRSGGQWRMALAPQEFRNVFLGRAGPLDNSPPTFAAYGDGFAVLRSGRVFLRRRGAYEMIYDPSSGAVRATLMTVSGSDLIVWLQSGDVRVYDGAAWTSLPGTPDLVSIWGSRTQLYGAFYPGVRRFDGTRWANLPSPVTAGYTAVAGDGAGDVFAISAETLYQVTPAAVVTTPAPACPTGAPRMRGLTGGAGQLLAWGTCGADAAVWRRSAGAWQRLPDLGPLPYAQVSLSASGGVFVTGDGGTVLRLVGGAWESYVDQPAPPVRAITGRSATEAYSAGATGVFRLVSDRWTQVTGSESMNVERLTQTPDGALFAVAREGASVYALWRYQSGAWHRDAAFPSTDATPHRIRGRASTDVYWVNGTRALHWNGAAWSDAGPVCAGLYKYALEGATDVRYLCPSAPENLWQIGPTASPNVLYGNRSDSLQLHTPLGNVLYPRDPAHNFNFFFGPSPSRVIGVWSPSNAASAFEWGFGWTDGIRAWSYHPELFTPWQPLPIYTPLPVEQEPFADDRNVYFGTRLTGLTASPNPDANNALLRCDLGP